MRKLHENLLVGQVTSLAIQIPSNCANMDVYAGGLRSHPVLCVSPHTLFQVAMFQQRH
jgi:hypothetical protein